MCGNSTAATQGAGRQQQYDEAHNNKWGVAGRGGGHNRSAAALRAVPNELDTTLDGEFKHVGLAVTLHKTHPIMYRHLSVPPGSYLACGCDTYQYIV